MTDSQLAAGTYEVLRNRLRDASTDLRGRLAKLNEQRAAVFGNIETRLITTERVTTDHNCVPRDLISIGDKFVFGYNVQFGLKTEIELRDVFSVYRFSENQFHQQPLDLIGDARFESDFNELYRFYKGTTFARFFRAGPMLHMVFRVGKTWRDIKSFKWRVTPDTIEYLDNRSEHEVKLPAQHAFNWVRTTRDQHHYGTHPHISIEDRVFIETVGGDLTVKVENNTDSGEGIYAEPVDHFDQKLDDAEIHYAILGNLVLMKVRPYQETTTRYLVYNGKIQQAIRLDEIEHACVMLPGDQGLIFPGGYYLQTGECKRFDHGLTDMQYQRTIASPNGEDYLYLFYNPESGTYVQLRYNLIRQNVDTPLVCHGQTFFEAGEMVCFKTHEDPQKHHPIQLWQTPFTGTDFVPENQTDSFLFKIGNKEIVRGMAECSELLQLIDKDDSYDGLYIDLVKKSSDVLDSYFWIDKVETERLSEPLAKIRDAASAAVDEFEKVVRVRRETDVATKTVQRDVASLIKEIERGRFESIGDYVDALAKLRQHRGHALALKDLRYVDLELIDSLEKETAERAERVSRRCVDFLLTPGALDPYANEVDAAGEEVGTVQTVAEAKELTERIDTSASQLELLTETVSNLRIDDATKRTEIIDAIGNVFASLNRVRSSLKARVLELVSVEGQAEFASQLKLLQQTTSGYLDVSDTPVKCDEYLTKVMVQLEELEGRFAEFDEFVVQLAERREEVYAAFETRKVQLIEKQNRRAESLASAADRILKGIDSRVRAMESSDEMAAYFAGDLMVEKVRDIIRQLEDLDDAVRVGDLESRLKTIREDASRQLKDRQDLYEEGGDVIRLGRHRFAVNTQPLDLTTVLRSGEVCLHLTGTQFFEPLRDEHLTSARDLWDQELVSENKHVYRGEYLAVDLFEQQTHSGRKPNLDEMDVGWMQAQLSGRFSEGYAKGVHDVDASKILAALLELHASIGLLKHSPSTRAASLLWFTKLLDAKQRKAMTDWIGGFAKLAQAYPKAKPAVEFRERLMELADADRLQWQTVFSSRVTPQRMAEYLFDQFVESPRRPVASQRAAELYHHFTETLPTSDREKLLDASMKANESSPLAAFILARNWADAFLSSHATGDELDPAVAYLDELAWLVLTEGTKMMKVADARVARKLEPMAGSHPRIERGTLALNYHELLGRVRHYRLDVVPRFRNLHETKNRLVDEARTEMRLEEFKPRVLTSFVRNQLLDEVYLPLIGDNLAKQMGVAGADKRTDRMGLLLLISPPGYGKTTLMEYVANRLGVVFMKINGPAIGHGVTSLDPAEAPNAAAREEMERLNLALEMGDNVMLYLDDIQHTNPELLQKFISLCDATRKIEGVRNGKTRTYDLRGRRVAVVMAGNPYTESGDRFQIPDMLSNRADVYNLGEIIGDSADAFEMSYLENCLTSNPTLAPLSTVVPEDSRAIIRAAERDSLEGIELQSNLSMDQVREMYEVVRKLLRVRDVVLKVNRSYIRSAAQADAYRTEPPFKLQGSYRNMNRIAERVAGVMNEQELQTLIVSNYEQDAQTLTTDNEANVLKFKELLGMLSAEEKERWDSIKYAYVESVRMSGMDSEDQVGQVMRQLASMRDGLESIRQVISRAISMGRDGAEERMDSRLDLLRQSLTTSAAEVSQTLAATSKQLERISEQQALSPPDQKVLVQHKVPRVLADLVKGQFHLMQEWLRPILSESIDNGRDLERLKHQLERMLKNYDEVQASLEPGGGSQHSEPESEG
ncbi:DNA repair ATPase [Novipirellula artificiosorum]|uniref:Holliday junction DNA helicase RuvB n=1 Tax=Novipirellula artificiosorum TaxID=2528016 RepID=A0A5C6DQH0_9BACT|nr:DNA repair ATPase [Novipirellula artificiosorum]TWU37266.1 Holliday junction DNA helicase RuvB [Novipirellula artificiosorum]